MKCVVVYIVIVDFFVVVFGVVDVVRWVNLEYVCLIVCYEFVDVVYVGVVVVNNMVFVKYENIIGFDD